MSDSTAQVMSAIEGGTITLTYETDPATLDGLTQDEIVTAVVGLIPALIYAATYGRFDAFNSAETLREHADVWDPQDEVQYVSSRSLTDTEDVLIPVTSEQGYEYEDITYDRWADNLSEDDD